MTYNLDNLRDFVLAVDVLNAWIRSDKFKAIDHPGAAAHDLKCAAYSFKTAAIEHSVQAGKAVLERVKCCVPCRCLLRNNWVDSDCPRCDGAGKVSLGFIQSTIRFDDLFPVNWLTPLDKAGTITYRSPISCGEIRELPSSTLEPPAAPAPRLTARSVATINLYSESHCQTRWCPMLWIGGTELDECYVCHTRKHPVSHRTFVESGTRFYWTAVLCEACRILAYSLPIPDALMTKEVRSLSGLWMNGEAA